MDKEKKQEFTLRISQANKTQLVVILYDMVLTYLKDSLNAFEKKNIEEYKKNIQNAKDCIDELINSLDFNYQPAQVLRGLYFFYKRELTTAAVQQKKESVISVMKMVQELREAYEEVSRQDTSAPVMENAQTVYAGLTYGKNSLNVNLSDQGTNRGFRI